ncbi:hypothetical protein GGX14DRAFT_78102 [Mycena pura]|uniref:BTB domain-containing protein n=1 Tax=Mycena pura TaxID=153505 RepID=A0AAD6VIJ3_9AGAR|nr:hypothetical protein GGX14DRAFT_78102 [Mycena pura]
MQEDSADEFRALCWAIYALPKEIELQTTRDGDVPRLLQIVKLSNRYNLPHLETWALEAVYRQCTKHKYAETCSEDMLERIMAVATLCNDSTLNLCVQLAWGSRIMRGELSHSRVLDAGAKCGERDFGGQSVYCIVM